MGVTCRHFMESGPLLSPFYRYGNEGSKRLSYSPKAAQRRSRRERIHTEASGSRVRTVKHRTDERGTASSLESTYLVWWRKPTVHGEVTGRWSGTCLSQFALYHPLSQPVCSLPSNQKGLPQLPHLVLSLPGLPSLWLCFLLET